MRREEAILLAHTRAQWRIDLGTTCETHRLRHGWKFPCSVYVVQSCAISCVQVCTSLVMKSFSSCSRPGAGWTLSRYFHCVCAVMTSFLNCLCSLAISWLWTFIICSLFLISVLVSLFFLIFFQLPPQFQLFTRLVVQWTALLCLGHNRINPTESFWTTSCSIMRRYLTWIKLNTDTFLI